MQCYLELVGYIRSSIEVRLLGIHFGAYSDLQGNDLAQSDDCIMMPRGHILVMVVTLTSTCLLVQSTFFGFTTLCPGLWCKAYKVTVTST